MLTVSFGLCLLLQGAAPFPASRSLPADRTLVAVELRGAEQLWTHRAAIAQLAIFERPRVQAMLRWIASTSPSMKLAIRRAGDFRDLLMAFDRGWTGATIFTPRAHGRPEPAFYLVASASDAKRTRIVGPRLARILRTGQRKDLEERSEALADSPVSVRLYNKVFKQDTNPDYSRVQGFYYTVKGRFASFHSEYGWNTRTADEELDQVRKKVTRHRLDVLGSLIGIGARTRGGARLGKPFVPPDGGEALGHFVYHIKRNIESPTHGPSERMREEFRKSGFGQWAGVQSCLWSDAGGVPHEHAEIRFTAPGPGDAVSFFDCFQGNERGLGDAAQHLPAHALGAVRVALDGKHATRWLYEGVGDGMRLGRDDCAWFLGRVRAFASLPDSKDKEPAIDELHEITVALLPPAAGSLFPEMVVALRLPEHAGEIDRILGAVVSSLSRMGKPTKPRVLGKGADAVHYVSFKQVLASRGGGMNPGRMAMQILSSVFGGGFVSAAREVETLYVGFNPRTMRKLLRAVRAGKTLATREGFLEHFPKASGRPLEAWFDFPGVARAMKGMQVALPFLFLGLRAVPVQQARPVAGGSEEVDEEADESDSKPKMILPTVEDLAAVVREEYLTSERKDYGFGLDVQGGTLLSPTAWTAVVFAATYWDAIVSLAR